MKTALSTFFFCLFSLTTNAQTVINKAYPVQGLVQLAEDIAIPKIENGYTLWLPDKGKAQGLIVFTRSRRDTIEQDSLLQYALSHQLAVLYATTDNRVEFFFEQDRLQEIESYIHEAISEHHIPRANLLYCGMSLEGTRALKLAIYGQSPQSQHHLKPRAIAICDAPLDMVRFHKEAITAWKLNFSPIAANEGKWVSSYLESQLDGTPQNQLQAFIDYSPYCYLAETEEKLAPFSDIAVRAYTEPDVHWWMANRRKAYYGMNAIDLAGLINALNIFGNEQAELILTENQGYRPDGSRHPHSWSIVDEKEMINWFLGLIKK